MSSLAAPHGSPAEPPRPARSHASALRDPVTAALWHHHLDIQLGPGGSIALLSLAGDIDMLTLPLVCAALVAALETQAADLVVDLGAVRFCGVRGSVDLPVVACPGLCPQCLLSIFPTIVVGSPGTSSAHLGA